MKVTLGTKEGLSAIELSVNGRHCPEQLGLSLTVTKGDWTGNQGGSPDGDQISTANAKNHLRSLRWDRFLGPT